MIEIETDFFDRLVDFGRFCGLDLNCFSFRADLGGLDFDCFLCRSVGFDGNGVIPF